VPLPMLDPCALNLMKRGIVNGGEMTMNATIRMGME